MQRLIKIEQRIYEIARENGLEFCDIEFDVIPDQKMLEIMAYRIPSNISNWKFGRDYEKLRTYQESVSANLPLEVVLNTNPSRAYLMKDNVLAVQVMVMAHVVAHVSFFTMNSYFKETSKDVIQIMSEASKRFEKYEMLYGIDEIERTIDAGHSIQFHSSPFDIETEDEKRERIFEQTKQREQSMGRSEFDDIDPGNRINPNVDIALFNQQLWKELRQKTPVEPTEDLLRYLIDNSTNIEDWQKDVLEILRREGQYFWPQLKTKYMNEGFATYWHERIMKQLFHEGLLNKTDHAQYNISNSLVKAKNPFSLNPYMVGSGIWEDIVMRWDKGRHGYDWDNCNDTKERENWDTGEMKGREKMFEVLRTYTDWMFMKNFLTADLVDELGLYIYVVKETAATEDIVITKQEAEKIARMITESFTHSHIPKIDVVDGNYQQKNYLLLKHRWAGANLLRQYAKKTLQHVAHIWGKNVYLESKVNKDKKILYKVERKPTIRNVKEKARVDPVSQSLKNDFWSSSCKID